MHSQRQLRLSAEQARKLHDQSELDTLYAVRCKTSGGRLAAHLAAAHPLGAVQHSYVQGGEDYGIAAEPIPVHGPTIGCPNKKCLPPS